MIEKEYKILLSKEQYERILRQISFEDELVQINFYYSNNLKDTTIRVRAREDKMYLQVKEPISKEGGRYIRKEYEKEIKSIPYVITADELKYLCRSSKYSDAFLLSQMVTERKIARIKKCEIALDINHYCGITDYELEIEYEDNINDNLKNILKKEKIYNNNFNDKFTRFLSQYKKFSEP